MWMVAMKLPDFLREHIPSASERIICWISPDSPIAIPQLESVGCFAHGTDVTAKADEDLTG